MNKHCKRNISEILGRSSVHPFPARMAPGIAMEVMSNMKGALRVLDPMMGSGTVPALARSNGHRAFGYDIDPLAVLMSRAWTTSCNHTEAREAAEAVLKDAKVKASTLNSKDAYPPNADVETQSFIEFWFDCKARKELTALADSISTIQAHSIQDVLWCAFSRLIITKQNGVSLAMDLSHSRPHRVFESAPVMPFDKFLAAVDRVLDGVVDNKSPNRGPVPQLKVGDARHLPLANHSIDLVITSPPYLNAIDYVRCSKFSLVWMGYSIEDLRKLRAESVGSEVSRGAHVDNRETAKIIGSLRLESSLNARYKGILTRYIDDMRKSVNETTRVLRSGGTVVYVVGENTVRNTFIRTALIVKHLAKDAGLQFVSDRTRALPANRRYLPPPSLKNGAMDTRMRQEVVLTFSK